MTSFIVTENIFNSLSDDSKIPDKSIQNSGVNKTTECFKPGHTYYVHNKYVPEKEQIRNQAFTKITDKNSLYCTKACNFSVKNTDTGKYGKCIRYKCTFAHSLEELQDPKCVFDSNCKYQWGYYDNMDGLLYDNEDDRCPFIHSNETRDEWIKRTGKKLPDLPYSIKKSPVLGNGYVKKCNPSTPPTRITLKTPSTPVKEKIQQRVGAIKNLSKEFEDTTPDKKSCEKSSISSAKEIYIIKVPNENLAAIAINSAFEKGVFNIQVIIE